MHLPNGTFAVFGGNSAIGPNGANNDPGSTPNFDPVYGDHNGGASIRLITGCQGPLDQPTSGNCVWYDSLNGPKMQRQRWYAGAEPLGDGTVVIVGGLVYGGFINRQYPNVDPVYENGNAEPTYEFWPPTGTNNPPAIFQFLVETSGLNAYPLMYLQASGKMFVQANYSTSYAYSLCLFESRQLTFNSSVGCQREHSDCASRHAWPNYSSVPRFRSKYHVAFDTR